LKSFVGCEAIVSLIGSTESSGSEAKSNLDPLIWPGTTS